MKADGYVTCIKPLHHIAMGSFTLFTMMTKKIDEQREIEACIQDAENDV